MRRLAAWVDAQRPEEGLERWEVAEEEARVAELSDEEVLRLLAEDWRGGPWSAPAALNDLST